jgi:steroid delta-isomerase
MTKSLAETAQALFEAYLARHATNDLEGVMALFEADAWVEDPVGSPIHRGLDAIRTFYRGTHRANGPMTIERVGPVLCGGAELAVHVRAKLDRPGSPPAMDVIYVIRLGDSGRIAALRAWF